MTVAKNKYNHYCHQQKISQRNLLIPKKQRPSSSSTIHLLWCSTQLSSIRLPSPELHELTVFHLIWCSACMFLLRWECSLWWGARVW